MAQTKHLEQWAAHAPRAHVFGTGLVMGLILALLAAVAVPEHERRETIAVSAPTGQSGSAPGVAPTSGLPATDPGAVTGGGVGGAGVTTASPGGGGAAPGAGLGGAGGAPAPGAGGGAPTGTPKAGGSAQPEARRASAQGVTADTIKIGFLVNKTGGLNATGFAIGIRQDQPETIKAMIDWANSNGGVAGRKVQYVIVEEDGTNAATWQPACIRMTEDEKVFAVMSGASHNGSGVLCYAQRRIPDLNTGSVTISEETFRRAGGFVVSTGASGSRTVLNWTATMIDAGKLGPSAGKLGLLTDECPQDVEVMDKALKPYLKKADIDFVETRVSCDVGRAQSQVASAVLEMRNAGVKVVFLGVLFPTAQTFMQQADAQAWKPKYLASDYWGNNLDFTAKNYPAEQFDRTIATAFSHTGEERAKVPYGEPVKACDKILRDAGLPGITEQAGKDAEVISQCDNFFLFMKIMAQMPVNPTHEQWPAAVAQLGAMKGVYGVDARFGSAKYNGGDSYAIVEWRRECTCWIQIRPHQPGRM